MARLLGNLILLFVVLTLTACASAPPVSLQKQFYGTGNKNYDDLDDQIVKGIRDNFFVLSFDREGQLIMNKVELSRAKEAISKLDPDGRIVILSYGWSYDQSAAPDAYKQFIHYYLQHEIQKKTVTNTVDGWAKWSKKWVILCVAWGSSESGISQFLGDLVPAPTLTDEVAWIPDHVLFPFTFWAKARLADRIGYSGLPDALEVLLLNENDHRIYLIGHSFGTRALSGLAQTRAALNRPLARKFKYTKSINGAVFLEPALAPANLPSEPDYPLVVTQSRHDHANGILFPIGNLILNSYAVTAYDNWIASELNQRYSEQSSTAKNISDIFRLPATLVLTAVLTPINYVGTQLNEIYHRPIDYIPDTLAQLPVVGPLVSGLHPDWGQQHKGLFSLGPITDSAAWAGTPPLGSSNPGIYSFEDWGKNSTYPSRLIYVDLSSVLCNGEIFTLIPNTINYNNTYDDSLRGWSDVVGSHNDWQKTDVYDLIDRVLLDQIEIDPAKTITHSQESSELKKCPPPASAEGGK